MAVLFGIDCAKSRGLIGTESCVVEPGPKTGHIVLPGRPMFDVATDMPNKAFFNNLIQQGKAYFIGGAFSVVTEVGDPTTETSDTTQQQVVVTRSLPMVTTTLKKSYEFHKEFYTLSSQDEYSVIEVYQNVIKVYVSKDGLSWGGFNTGMYEVLTYEDATGSTRQQTRVMYQITDLAGYNTQGQFLTGLDFNPNSEMNNVVRAQLRGSANSGENDVYVSAVWANNPMFNLEAFSKPNFVLKINDVATTIDTVTYVPAAKNYKLTFTGTALSASDDVEVYLHDALATPPVDVAKVGTNSPKFYSGTTGVFNPTGSPSA